MAQDSTKYLEAQSVEQVAELLKADGEDVAKAEAVWQEVSRLREQMGKDLSLDELDAVAGGIDRDWWTEGCGATVEPGSGCLVQDAGCLVTWYAYRRKPGRTMCIFCGAPYTYESESAGIGGRPNGKYGCRVCKRWFKWDRRSDKWVEIDPIFTD